jgi:zinc protease
LSRHPMAAMPHSAALSVRSGMAALVLLLLVHSPARALNIEASHFTLDNGLQVVVIADRRAPVLTHMVWYPVGSADEPQGKAGIAHFLEHLLFKGTKTLKTGEFSGIVYRHGGEDNAFTSRDYTAYYQQISRDRLGLVMELEADRMANLVLTQEDVATELEVVREERREIENDPASLLSEQMHALLYTAHPYRKPVIGWMTEVEGLNLDDAMSFYRTHYTPGNAIVVVAGDVTAEEVLALAERHYGPLENTADRTLRARTPEPEPIAARRVEMIDDRAASPMLQRSYLAASYATAGPGEAEALEVLAQVLGGGRTSRLHRRLVVRSGISAYAEASYSGEGLDGGTLTIEAAPNPGGHLDAIESEIDAVIAAMASERISEDELDRARNRLIADAVFALDDQFYLATIFGMALSSGQTAEDVLAWTRRVEQVSAEDVRKAAAKFLRIERSVTGILLPEAQTAHK